MTDAFIRAAEQRGNSIQRLDAAFMRIGGGQHGFRRSAVIGEPAGNENLRAIVLKGKNFPTFANYP